MRRSSDKSIKVKNLLILILHIVLSSIAIGGVVLLPSDIEFTTFNAIFSAVLILISVAQVITLYCLPHRSLFAIGFLVISYLYNCSQAILNTIGKGDAIFPFSNLYDKFGYAVYIEANEVAFISMQLLFVGFLVANLFNENVELKKNNTECADSRIMIKFGKAILLFSVPFAVYVQGQLFVASHISYIAVHETIRTINFIIWIIGDMPIVGIIALILGYSQRTSFRIYAVSIVYYTLLMFTGLRAYSFGYILILSYLYFGKVLHWRFSAKKMLYAFLGGYFLFGFVSTIGKLRSEMDSSFLEIYFSNIISGDTIVEVLSEMSITQMVLGTTITFENYRLFAHQLIGSMLSIVPFISYIMPESNFLNYQVQNTLDIITLGGSYTSDFYFDKLTFIGPAVFGYLIYKLFLKFEYSNNVERIAYLTPIVLAVLFCVRSTIYKLPRTLIWYLILYFILKKIIFLFILNNQLLGSRENMKE